MIIVMKYIVKKANTPVEWSNIPKACVESYVWGCEYRPEVYGQFCFNEGKGFTLKMTCFEKNPRAVYENHNDMVCRDSCMEFFVNFAPEKENTGYLNFEANSKGTLLLYYGPDRNSRTPIVDMGLTPPKVNAKVLEDHWEYTIEIPMDFIKSVFGKDTFKSGDVLKGNFYKCGDDTASPHYGSWSPITNPTPDFHRPEFFGDLIIE